MVKVELAGIVNGFKLICVSQLGFGLHCVARLKEQPLILPVNLFLMKAAMIRRGSAVIVCEVRQRNSVRSQLFSVCRFGPLLLAERISLSEVLFPLRGHGGQEDSEEGF